MRIAITGSSGLIGSALAARLRRDGHRVTRVVRSRAAAAESDAILWKPRERVIDSDGLAGQDVVINLAGESIAGIWTASKKRRIRESRVAGTGLLAQAITGLDEARRPRVLINASAVGYYGDRSGDGPQDESASPGRTFMADVVRAWERAADPAREAGVRVVLTRFAPVLAADALLLRMLATATRLGLGAKIGDGDQPFPWVTRDEIIEVMEFLLDHPEIDGPVNVAPPAQTTNEEFVDTLARVLDRSRFLKVPTAAMRLLGDQGRELTGGAWMAPTKLERAGYVWRDPALEPALRRMLETGARA